MEDIFEKLKKIIEMRKNERPETSYVAELWKKGDDFILKKNLHTDLLYKLHLYKFRAN